MATDRMKCIGIGWNWIGSDRGDGGAVQANKAWVSQSIALRVSASGLIIRGQVKFVDTQGGKRIDELCLCVCV